MERDHAEAEQQSDLDDHQDQAAASQSHEKVSAAHGGGHEALQELALAHIHERESDAPHAGVHQIHTEQARNEEVDVARSRLAGSERGGRDYVFASRRSLQGIVHFTARPHAFRTGRVIVVLNFARRERLDYQVVLAETKSLQGASTIYNFGVDRILLRRILDERNCILGVRTRNYRDSSYVRRLVAKC